MMEPKLLHKVLAAAFRFVIAVDGNTLGAFTECTLPSVEWEVEAVREGGVNTYVHQLPSQRRQATVTLKNGVGLAPDLMDWYLNAMNEVFKRCRVTITLLSPAFTPLMVMHIEEALPIKWTGPNMRSDDNTIAIQTLELACGEITLE
jgi:phage tail-like protein